MPCLKGNINPYCSFGEIWTFGNPILFDGKATGLEDGIFEVGCTSVSRDELMILERFRLQEKFCRQNTMSKSSYGIFVCHVGWRWIWDNVEGFCRIAHASLQIFQ